MIRFNISYIFLILIFVSTFTTVCSASNSAKDQDGCGSSCGTNSIQSKNPGLFKADKPVYDEKGLDSKESREDAGLSTNKGVTPNLDGSDNSNSLDVAADKALEGQPGYDEAAAANQAALDAATGGSPKEEDTSTNNILGIQNNDLRNGNVDMDTIPKVIISIINVLLGVAGTISIVSLMYHAVKMQINSGITGDSSGVDHAKKGMIGSIIGFVVAIMAWFIVIRFIEILSGLS